MPPESSENVQALNAQRRASDPRIDALVADVATLRKDMIANTEITAQVRDILASFRVIGAVTKWAAAVGGGCVAAYAAIKGLAPK
jgi:hypothetical protein